MTTDPIVVAATFLVGHIEWLRHRPECEEALRDFEACERIIRSIARGPSEQRYLGPCGAPVSPDTYEPAEPGAATIDCPGDVYGHPGGTYGVCRVCGATYDTDARRTWLNDEVRGHAFRATDIAAAYDINVNTIRSWATRGQLAAHGHDPDGRPLYNIGDVLDLAAADIARRAGNQARRARRTDRRLSA